MTPRTGGSGPQTRANPCGHPRCLLGRCFEINPPVYLPGFWVLGGTRADQPYRCRCDERPAGSRSCWRNCPCAGRTDLVNLPPECCAHRNPLRIPAESWAAATGQAPGGVSRGHGAPGTRSGASHGGSGGPVATEGHGSGSDGLAAPALVRIFAPGDLTCTCRTPWDRLSRGGGVHCSDCHCHFQNALCYSLHRPRLLVECRDPGDICDVDTGRQLLGLMMVGGHPVWYWSQYRRSR